MRAISITGVYVIVECLRIRQRAALEGSCPRLDFPYDPKRLIRLGVVVDASKSQQVLARSGRTKRIRGELICFDFGHDPPALTHLDELTLLWNVNG